MHKRPEEKHHGGLWEFPGGKVEDFEIPVESLVRELREEIGISFRPLDCRPIAFAEERAVERQIPLVILLYRIARWEGEPEALEGGEVGWFSPREIAALDKPPLDIELAERLFSSE